MTTSESTSNSSLPQVTVTAPSELVLYARAFEKLAGLAVYGAEARARITDAISVL